MQRRQDQSHERVELCLPNDIYYRLATLATKHVLSPVKYIERALAQRESLELIRDGLTLNPPDISQQQAQDILVYNQTHTLDELDKHEPYTGIQPNLAAVITITRSIADLFHLQATTLREGFNREEEYILASMLLSFGNDEKDPHYLTHAE